MNLQTARTKGSNTPFTTVNSATYAVKTTDLILHVTYSATGACTITIPTAQMIQGRLLIIKDAGGLAATNNITIVTEGSETIDGISSSILNGNYNSVNLYSDGQNLFIY